MLILRSILPVAACLAALALLLSVVPGCSDRPSREELGRVLYEVPETPETEQPYELKQLEDPGPENGSTRTEP